MIRPMRNTATRRVVAATRAIVQGLVGVALVALAALVLVPEAHAADPAAAPMTLEAQTFPGSARVANTELRLNGVGLRAAFIYKVYVAGLYLPAKAVSGAVIYAAVGKDPVNAPDRFQSFVAQGVEVTVKIKLWEKK